MWNKATWEGPWRLHPGLEQASERYGNTLKYWVSCPSLDPYRRGIWAGAPYNKQTNKSARWRWDHIDDRSVGGQLAAAERRIELLPFVSPRGQIG